MQLALLEPEVAVIVAVPAETPVTTPELLTLATELLLLVQLTVASVAVEGKMVVVRVEVSPTTRLSQVTVVVVVGSSLEQDVAGPTVSKPTRKRQANFFISNL